MFKVALNYSTVDKIKQQGESILKHVILSVLSKETSLYTLFFLVLEQRWTNLPNIKRRLQVHV